MPIRQIATSEAYSHLSNDVRAAIEYVNEVAGTEDPLVIRDPLKDPVLIRDRLFRAGLRVMRAEKELAALNAHIAALADAHGIEP